MYYEVNAVLITARALELRGLLRDGSIRHGNMDGREICDSMMRARLDETGRVCWTQASFSSDPLKYEIESVYRHYFEDMKIREVEGHITFHGPMFMDHLLVLEMREQGQLPKHGEGL